MQRRTALHAPFRGPNRPATVLHDYTTNFVGRLRSRDPQAWFELWETFGPILRNQLSKWGQGRLSLETVQDLSQETMTALASAIDRHDPSKGARFSTWLLAIAKYTLGDEIDRRMAQKRGAGQKPISLDASFDREGRVLEPDERYEEAVFDAKVEAALRHVERETDFVDFSVFRSRVLEGSPGRVVAEKIGVSEATVSRKLAGVRKALRAALEDIVAKYSFTPEEWAEPARNGLDLSPNKPDDALFDDALAEVYHRLLARRRAEEAEISG